MTDNALELVRIRNDFYRNNYRRCIIVLLLSMILNFSLGGVTLYLYLDKSEPVYFATNVDGRLLEMVPLHQPYASDEEVLQLAESAVLAAYSFNFLDFQGNLQQARKYFTAQGFSNYIKALDDAGIIDYVKKGKYVVSAKIARDADVRITQKGPVGQTKRYAWRVVVPVDVNYVGTTAIEATQPLSIMVLVARVSTLQSPSGIAIAQIVVRNRNTNTAQ